MTAAEVRYWIICENLIILCAFPTNHLILYDLLYNFLNVWL
jgi:hypothetical protein